jgi:hypothetical protein
MLRNTIDTEKKKKLQERMYKKLDKNTPWSYIPKYLPANTSEQMLIEKMKYLIDHLLNQAVELSTPVLATFSHQDCDSIGTNSITENACRFLEIITFLENNGFPGPISFAKPINFFSGNEAKKRAYHSQNELSLIEGMIPCFTVLYDLWYAAQQKPNTSLMFCTLSKVLAYYAKGTVNVYLSDNLGKPAGLVVGSYFWDMELPVLQHSQTSNKEERITDIMIHVYDQDEGKWRLPVSLYSKEINDIPIYIKEIKNRFVPNEEFEGRNFNGQPISLGYVKI